MGFRFQVKTSVRIVDPTHPETLALPRRCPRCGLEIPDGQASCPACAAAAPPPSIGPAVPALGDASGSGLSGQLASVAGILLTSLAMFPAALHFVGWGALGEAIERSMMARGGLFLAGLASMIWGTVITTRRARTRQAALWGEIAARTGGTLTIEPRSLSRQGWGGGPTLRCPVGEWTVTCETLCQSKSCTVRMSARVAVRRDFVFLVCAQSLAGKLVTSPKLWHFVLAQAGRTAAPSGAAADGSAAIPGMPYELGRLSYLTGDDVTVGDPEFDKAFIVKTNAESTARELFGDSGLRSRLLDLRSGASGAVFMLAPLREQGMAVLQYQMGGPATDVERVAAVHGLMAAMLQALSQAGVISDRAAVSA